MPMFSGCAQLRYVLVLLIFLPGSLEADFAGGLGERNNPYRIENSQQLNDLGLQPSLLDKHFILTNDIDLDPNLPNGQVYHQSLIGKHLAGMPTGDPITNFDKGAFNGSFDGNGFAIRNFKVKSDAKYCIGLFGRLGENAKIENLRLEAFHIQADGTLRAGLLAGENNGHVFNCSVDGHFICGPASSEIGGLIGMNRGTVFSCRASCVISRHSPTSRKGNRAIGGLIGENCGTISCCQSEGMISGTSSVGGLCGNAGRILNSFSTCTVNGQMSVGGLAGGGYGSISCCYSTGRVDRVIVDEATMNMHPGSIGGLIGYQSSTVFASFWDIATSGQHVSHGGEGFISNQIRSREFFCNRGWDFIAEDKNGTLDVWYIPTIHSYPQLRVFSTSHDNNSLPGDGTFENPYLIDSPKALGAIADHNPEAYYKLVTDIDLSGICWPSAPIWYFNGVFLGDGHVIANLQIKGTSDLGLFDTLGGQAKVVALGLDSIDITGASNIVGGIAASNAGIIEQCFVKGMISGRGAVGGIVSVNSGVIQNCYMMGSVSGKRHIAGIVSHSMNGKLLNCYSVVSISAEAYKGHTFAGNLLSYYSGMKPFMDNCYYHNKHNPGNNLGQALDDQQIRQSIDYVGWDFTRIWKINEGGKEYPKLKWEKGG